MVKIDMKVIDPDGLHARPASVLSGEAVKYSSNIQLEYGEKKANMKSIMSIMALGIGLNSEIAVCTDGEDEELALSNLVELIKVNKIAE